MHNHCLALVYACAYACMRICMHCAPIFDVTVGEMRMRSCMPYNYTCIWMEKYTKQDKDKTVFDSTVTSEYPFPLPQTWRDQRILPGL